MRVLSFFLVGFLFSCAGNLFVRPLVTPASAADLRTRTNLNEGWHYLESNTASVATATAATPTKTVDLPHTWNQWDATDNAAGYRRDASWYLKELSIPTDHTGRVILHFEGANTNSDVYVNGRRAGGHVGGYVGFRVDITDYLHSEDENLLAVRVTNAYNPDIIPSQKSDFFIYGGLTRDVWLELLPAVHLDQFHVSTPDVSKQRATTKINYTINGSLGAAAGAQKGKGAVRATLRRAGTDIPLVQAKVEPRATGELSLPVLDNPQLWSPTSPTLYELDLELLAGDQTLDKKTTTLGYRFYDFVPNGPFRLNGERLLLRGTHRHEEHAGYGAAMPNELHRRDLEMIKEMGANFVRLGHYPQDPEVYRAADELGLILWDELPWCRGGKGEAVWEANTKRLLREQIAQNYNHPSIFFWSLGNEIYWLPDFPGGDDPDAMNTFLSELNDIAHKLDPYRLTSIRKYYAGADRVDVFSPSIWSGWYAGVYSNYATALEDARTKYPNFLHMEYGGSSHVGRHTENPITGAGTLNENEWAEAINQVNVKNVAKSGDWTENYIVDLFDWHLRVSETSDWFAGNAQWAFKDFGTPLRPENAIPYLNQKGLVDRAGKPKDAFYVFKSYWSDEPFVYLESHTWTERSGPAGKPREIVAYSSCDSLELFHNGQRLGGKAKDIDLFPAGGYHWPVIFAEGENNLRAVGYTDGQQTATDELNVNYTYQKAGSPHKIVLSSTPLQGNWQLVEARMVDKAGNRVLDYEGRVYFDCNGTGSLLVDYGTPTRSQVIEMANGRAAIEVEVPPGKTVIEARNQDFKGSYLVLSAPVKK
ncbi:MAG: glycoside hydrolase family 2 TIM barrel-domain containing protein [Bacteroidota bacterium]